MSHKEIKSKTSRPKHTPGPKHFYVPWQGYSDGEASRLSGHPLDTLCLQGPHDRETAHRIAREIRETGLYASVIDSSESLRWEEVGPEMLEALELALVEMGRAGANADVKHPLRPSWEKVRAAIAKAEGRDE